MSGVGRSEPRAYLIVTVLVPWHQHSNMNMCTLSCGDVAPPAVAWISNATAQDDYTCIYIAKYPTRIQRPLVDFPLSTRAISLNPNIS